MTRRQLPREDMPNDRRPMPAALPGQRAPAPIVGNDLGQLAEKRAHSRRRVDSPRPIRSSWGREQIGAIDTHRSPAAIIL